MKNYIHQTKNLILNQNAIAFFLTQSFRCWKKMSSCFRISSFSFSFFWKTGPNFSLRRLIVASFPFFRHVVFVCLFFLLKDDRIFRHASHGKLPKPCRFWKLCWVSSFLFELIRLLRRGYPKICHHPICKTTYRSCFFQCMIYLQE